MRKHNILFLSLICFSIITEGKAYSQVMSSASATGHIFAEVFPVFSASETSQMNFGRFSPGPQGGQIILTPESTISSLGSVFKGSGSHNAASFYITGDVDLTYLISLPNDPVVLTNTSSAKTMKVEDWVSIPAPGAVNEKLQNGFQVIHVGATLKIGTIYDNPVGKYTGTYTITFEFN